MNFFHDLQLGWRARPLRAAALATLTLGISLLAAWGLRQERGAAAEAAQLLREWPAERATLVLSDPSKDPDLLRETQRRLPGGSWLAWRVEGETAWIDGSPQSGFFEGAGRPPAADELRSGEAVAWVTSTADPAQRPGSLLRAEGQLFRVLGRGSSPWPVRQVLPARAGGTAFRQLDHLLVDLTAAELELRMEDLIRAGRLRLIDHQSRRREATAGFRRLRLQLGLLRLAGAGITALLLQALYHAEIRERRPEFALRRALGARPADIRNQVLGEVMCTAGLPSAAGWLAAAVWLGARPVAVPLGISLGWIALCALIPALQAARLPPGEALQGG